MKFTAILLLAFCLQAAAKGYSQITLKEKNAPLQKVFAVIKQQTGYDFLYPETVVEQAGKVTIAITNVSLETALEVVLKDKGLGYSIVDKTIIIRKKEEPFSTTKETQIAPTVVTITGRITNESGEPVAGVSVLVKGTNNGTTTNANGEYSLQNVEENATLVFSATNIEGTEIKVNGKTEIDVVAKTKISKLDEVQVQAYGTTKLRTATGNITTIKADEIERQPVNNPILALQGRVPGLVITPTSGLPGSAVKIQLRGQNSLTGVSSEPLIVIDGVPYLNNTNGKEIYSSDMSALYFINPSDIASIDVLKDADATSIYGSRGANGVILITTKGGKIGKTRIDINAFTGFTEQKKRIKLLNTQQYLEMRKEAFSNDGLPIPNSSSVPDWGNYDLALWDQNRYTDWQEEFLGDRGSFSSAQISISGGNPFIQYLISGTYRREVSLFPGHPKSENGVAHFSLTGTSNNKKLKATLTGGYNADNRNLVDFSKHSIGLAPNAPLLYKGNSINWEPNSITGYATWKNPLSSLANTSTINSTLLNVNLQMNYQLSEKLNFIVSGGISNLLLSSFTPGSLAAQDPATMSFAIGSSEFNTNNSKTFILEPQVQYKERLFDGKLDVIVGGTSQNQQATVQYLYADGFTSDGQLKNLNAATNISGRSTSSDYKYVGVFGRMVYNWQERYILSLNARRDGSSKFGPDNRYGNFASVGAAWVFSNEKFIQQNLPFISFGKLRASYGSSGNDNIGNYAYLELFGYNQGVSGNYQGINTISSSGVVNPNYHWETTKKLEGAIEVGFFKDRLILSSAYFQNRSSDQLGNTQIPFTAGNYSVVLNQPAKIQNNGMEFTLVSRNISTKRFTWTTSGNISFTRNKLLTLPKGFTGMPIIYDDKDPVGKPFAGVVPVYEYKGMDPVTGLYQFADKDGKIAPEPWAAYAYAKTISTWPKFTGGISNRFTYSNFDLDVFLQFTKQMGVNYLFDPGINYAGSFYSSGDFSENANIPLELFENSWRKNGDVGIGQRFSTYGSLTSQRLQLMLKSDRAWVDASFIRVKNVSLSYNVPNKLKEKWKLQNCRIYIQGQNLFTFTTYKGTDPETQSITNLAPLRVITAGFQLGF